MTNPSGKYEWMDAIFVYYENDLILTSQELQDHWGDVCNPGVLASLKEVGLYFQSVRGNNGSGVCSLDGWKSTLRRPPLQSVILMANFRTPLFSPF